LALLGMNLMNMDLLQGKLKDVDVGQVSGSKFDMCFSVFDVRQTLVKYFLIVMSGRNFHNALKSTYRVILNYMP
jgi:hypothetical protein